MHNSLCTLNRLHIYIYTYYLQFSVGYISHLTLDDVYIWYNEVERTTISPTT
jgi:hypothetical protein